MNKGEIKMKNNKKNVWRQSCAILLVLFLLMSAADFSVFSGITAQAKESESRIVYFGNYIQREVTDEEELEVLRLSVQVSL